MSLRGVAAGAIRPGVAGAGRCASATPLSAILQFATGPLVAAAFFLPWAHGPGPLVLESYSGFELVGVAGRLQALELTIAQGAALWLIRLLILGVLIAGTWITLLGPRHRWHPVFAVSGWYVAGFAAITVALALLRSGVTTPPLGLALLIAAGVAWIAAAVARKVQARG